MFFTPYCYFYSNKISEYNSMQWNSCSQASSNNAITKCRLYKQKHASINENPSIIRYKIAQKLKQS